MGENTGIEWTHHTFNPWIGCTKVSAGCKNCYAEIDMADRRKRVVWGVNGTRSVTSYTYWREALSWNRRAGEIGKRKRVFCASLADVFEDFQGQVKDSKGNDLWWNEEWCDSRLGLAHVCEEVSGRTNYAGEKYCDVEGIPTLNFYTEDYMYKHDIDLFKNAWNKLTINTIRQYLFRLIQMTPNLDWLLLTKRPENILKMVPDYWKLKFPDNVWIGTSTEDHETFKERILDLIMIPAKVRFLSIEPQLGPISLWPYTRLTSEIRTGKPGSAIDWVICGGESGNQRRPFDCDWARKLRDECKETGVPFFMKQVDKKIPIPEDLLIREFPNDAR